MKRACCILLVLPATVVGPAAAGAGPNAEDWPRFRGPGGLGVSPAKGLPTTWDKDKGLAWRVELPGPGASSPIVIGRRIFVTCYSGYGVPGQRRGDMSQLQRHVLCLNLADGKLRWQKEVEPKLPEQARVARHGYASSTPVADAERLYLFFGKSGVFAFDHDGERLWQAEVGSRTHGWGSAASPVLYKDLLLVNASVERQSLVALNKRTGKEVWRSGEIRSAWNTPLLVNAPGGKTELALGVEGNLIGLDPDTGQRLWSTDGVRSYMCPSAVADSGNVYALWGRRTLAVRAGGRGDVTRTHQLWNFWKNNRGSLVSSPVYHDGRLYFASSQDGVVYCMDGRTGAIARERRLSPRPGLIYASPILADGKLYFVSRNGCVYVLAAKPSLEVLAVNDMADGTIFDASPAAVGGRLLLRSGRFLYAIGRK